ncbi:hypothetical protein DYB35_012420 [Aphanomyces astaci]|uniref:Serine protease n=1 Tax=Aphanomyces astaci TaxID=112090 RepID=A0A3R7B880_APHAT|nr:hypothetical protein DYB35_012420 [Aphanomyces astaci]
MPTHFCISCFAMLYAFPWLLTCLGVLVCGHPHVAPEAVELTQLDVGISCAQYPRTPTVVTFVVDRPDAAPPLPLLLLLHFDFLKLKPLDTLTVRAVVNGTVGAVAETFTSASTAPFFSVPLHATAAVLELHVTGVSSSESPSSGEACFGFHVDGVRTSAIDDGNRVAADESICGVDESKNAQCYVSSGMYTASKAVVRLLTHRHKRSVFCTGWLLGCDGHVLTNEHCIADAADAVNTTFEFMAEGVSCSTNCSGQGMCKAAPRLFTRGATFIIASKDLDYSLVKLSPATIPPGLGDGYRCAVDQAGYMLDTQKGSSGSPVVSAVDNTVVALHHCGGTCAPNDGVDLQA